MTATPLDLVGLKCPLPALRTGRALDALARGAELVVTASDPLATLDIPNLVRQRGDVLVAQAVDDGIATFRIRRAG